MEHNKTYAAALFLFIYIFPVALSLENNDNGFRVELSHIDSKGNFSQMELLSRATARARNRLSQLTGMQLFSSTNASTSVHYGLGTGEYLMDLAIGTPPVSYSGILDTGSDLVWTQCAPCKKCVSQPTPLYDPSKSSTVSSIPCNSTTYQLLCSTNNPPPSCLCSYNYTYVTGWTSGTLKKETFTFGTSKPVAFAGTVFGCSSSATDNFNGTSGLVGFSRGPFSLPSQYNTSMFSYCLGSFVDPKSKGTLFIGPWAKFSGSAVKSTPFVKNPSQRPLNTFYYLSLKGISLGTTNLSIQPSVFALQSNGDGGVIIDSGTAVTHLVNSAYQKVQNAVNSTMTLQRVDLPEDVYPSPCYLLPSGTSLPSMPNMTFHFEGADMVLPRDNYMISIPYDKGSLLCLAIFNSSDSQSIFGNHQQQNFHILYDISKKVLSFAPAKCDTI